MGHPKPTAFVCYMVGSDNPEALMNSQVVLILPWVPHIESVCSRKPMKAECSSHNYRQVYECSLLERGSHMWQESRKLRPGFQPRTVAELQGAASTKKDGSARFKTHGI